MLTIQGIDTSRYTDNILTPLTVDWQKCKAAGCRFIIMKATEGITIQDRVFKLHSQALDGLLPRGSYHYYRTNVSIREQVDYYYKFAGNLEIAPAMDLEDFYKELPKGNQLIQIVETFLDSLDQKFGRESILYTSPNIIKNYMALPKDHPLTFRQLWIANYKVSKPAISPWTTYLLWQYSETVDNQGRDGSFYGFTESKAMDMNYFNGTEEDFKIFTNGMITTPVENPIPVTNKMVLKSNAVMNIRNGPGVQYSKVGTLGYNESVVPINVIGEDFWIEISPGKFVCGAINGRTYLTQ